VLLVSGHLGHHFRQCFVLRDFVLRNLMSNFVSAFVMLEFVLFELMGQFRVFELMVFEFMRQFRVLEFMLLEFELVGQLRVLELVYELVLLEFLFAERLAGDPAKDGAERTADRRANHGRCYARHAPENRRSATHEPAYAARNAPKELFSFEFVGQFVLLPFGFVLLQLTEAAHFPFELQLHLAFVRHG
jgi:hypothetical protein